MYTIDEIVFWLNKKYNQQTVWFNKEVEYPNNKVIYFNYVQISFWDLGAIVNIRDKIYFVQHDDLNWFVSNSTSAGNSLHVSYIKDFVNAINRLKINDLYV